MMFMRAILKALVVSLLFLFLASAPPNPGPVANISVSVPGTGHHLVLHVLQSHGRMTEMYTYYAWDHYVHVDDLSRAPGIRDVQMYTCVNYGPCGDLVNAYDADSPGTLGQPHIGIHHNVTLTFYPVGTSAGFSLHQGHYEHGGEPLMRFEFADGFALTVYLPGNPWLYSINLLRTPMPNGHSGAAFVTADDI